LNTAEKFKELIREKLDAICFALIEVDKVILVVE